MFITFRSAIFRVRQFQALLFGPSISKSVIFRPCDLVRYFPSPSISDLAIWSVIFQVRHFQALLIGPSFSKSVNFRPRYLVRHFSGPSFSGFATWSVIFQVRQFQALLLGPSFSRSVIFRPCDLVRYFPVLLFQVLHFQLPHSVVSSLQLIGKYRYSPDS